MCFPNYWEGLDCHIRPAFLDSRNTTLSCLDWDLFGLVLMFETSHAFLSRSATKFLLGAGSWAHLCGSMIQRNVQNDSQTPTMCFSNQKFKIVHGPINRIDLSIIANVIPKICLCWLSLLCEPFKPRPLPHISHRGLVNWR